MSHDASTDWAPESCTLPRADQPQRLAEFDSLFSTSVRRTARVTATRLDLVLSGAAEPAARELAADEVRCCSFFTFDFASAGTDVVMRIGVPLSHTQVLDALADRVGAAADPSRGVP